MTLKFPILFAIAIATLGAGANCDSSPTSDGTERIGSPLDDRTILLVANKSDNTLSWLDVDTGEVLGTTTTGQGPHEVTITPDGKWAFVANYEGPGDSISLIDVEEMKEVKRISIDPFRAPHGIQATPDGKKVYATVERSRAVIELDVETEKITRSFATNQAVTHMLVLTPSADRVYTSSMGSGTSSIIVLEGDETVKHIATGAGAEGIDVTPDGHFVWVTNREDDTVSIIDTESDEKVADLPAPGFPIRVKITPDGKYALVSAASAGTVIVYDVDQRKEVKRVSTGATPVGVVIESSGKRAFIANTRANTISVMSIPEFEIIGTLRAGNTPDGMVLIPASGS
jgi:YVTN family beta-propeller protein